MHEANVENTMPTDIGRSETVTEHNLFMNQLMRKLKRTDENGKTQDPFIFAQTHVDKYPMYDESTHWRLRKPKVAISRESDYEMLKSKLKSADDQDKLVLSRTYSQKTWLVGDGLSKEEQMKASKGTLLISPYSQFPPKKNWLPRRVMSAWRIAGILHGLEGWNVNEYGNEIFNVDKPQNLETIGVIKPWSTCQVQFTRQAQDVMSPPNETAKEMLKSVVGEKYINVAKFKECLTYYALANGFSLWYERSGEKRVALETQLALLD
ncbi:sterol desaturase-like protein [Artemisia annua]|uniref:Sterol desaturase-like protein n=1 Tax=Artemisia annua TaxID=35608 RepID=A0A2U1KXC7_ARTAN|nr:sterol desaturase-like protein [Artemisia annua]